MKKNLMFVIITALMVSIFSGCGKNEADRVAEKAAADKQVSQTFQFIEDQRTTAKENAEQVAADYRSSNPRLSGMKIVGHTDSTISASCPSGDGWASISLMAVADNAKNRTTDVEKIKIKCSTVSLSLGCYLEKDFTEKPFAREENTCNKNLPSPLPKVAK